MRQLLGFSAVSTAILAVLVLPALVLAQQHTPMPDDQIKGLVEHRFSEKSITGVSVVVNERVVTLTGTVTSLWAKNEAADQARRIDDVVSVVSQLTIMRAEADEVIAGEIATQVQRYVFYSIFDDIAVGVDQGVVTLTGRVTMPFKAGAIEDLASRVKGVQAVKNDVRELPVSTFDDQLRYAIASQIYRDPMYWSYAIQATPPIPVIVEHGRVRLTGMVKSEIERRQAEIIARGTFGVLGVENELKVEGRTR